MGRHRSQLAHLAARGRAWHCRRSDGCYGLRQRRRRICRRPASHRPDLLSGDLSRLQSRRRMSPQPLPLPPRVPCLPRPARRARLPAPLRSGSHGRPTAHGHPPAEVTQSRHQSPSHRLTFSIFCLAAIPLVLLSWWTGFVMVLCSAARPPSQGTRQICLHAKSLQPSLTRISRPSFVPAALPVHFVPPRRGLSGVPPLV